MPYANKSFHVLSPTGDAISSPTVTVRRESDMGLATLFADRDGLVPLANPFVASSSGFASFYTAGGVYRVEVQHVSGYTDMWYVGIGTASERDAAEASDHGNTASAGKLATLGMIRERLTADRTYYVRTDGNNANSGRENNANGAWRDIQYAVTYVLSNIDFNSYNVTIQVGAGTYNEAVVGSSAIVGAGTLTVVGNETTPANCVVNGTAPFACRGRCNLTVRGFRLTGSIYNLTCDGAGSKLRFADIEFAGSPSFHVYVFEAGMVEAIGNYAITTAAGRFVMATDTGSYFSSFNRTVTITGTPAFTNFVQVEYLAGIQFGSCTFVGSATGPRYYVGKNGVIHTFGAGATYLPGNASGVADTGGVYA